MAEQAGLQTVRVNGVDLHYLEAGSGQPVILVHGSQGDYRNWRFQMEPFSKQFRVIAYSRRYHYPNEVTADATDYTAALHAGDLIALIETLGLAPVNLVGSSFGAYTSLVTATRRPDLLRKLVISEPPILPWLQDIPGGQAYYDGFMQDAWLPATEAFRRGELEQGLRLFVDGVSGKGEYDRLPDPVKSRFMENVLELKDETQSPGYFTKITPQQVEQIPLPMLLLKGEFSPRMFHLIVDVLADHARDCRLVVIPNSSHATPSGNPEAFNRVVLNFLSS